MADDRSGAASQAAQDADAVDEVTRNTKTQTEAASYTTTDHDVIRAWAEARGGRPAPLKSNENKNICAGVLRIGFRDDSGDLDEVDWEPFFSTFDDRKLAFVYQEHTSDGSTSRFNKLVSRDDA
ncbi:MAG: hypothetical protein ACTHMS_15070 [Jatrophihabitans sp.]|uniref:hypothetical protein n=1 Tax=Jatrophihabitans sp. TaxID=1932789 RepID=UPI003F806A98